MPFLDRGVIAYYLDSRDIISVISARSLFVMSMLSLSAPIKSPYLSQRRLLHLISFPDASSLRHHTGIIHVFVFVCWVFCFQSQKKKQFSESSLAAYLRILEIGTPAICGQLRHGATIIIREDGWGFNEYIPRSYAGPSSGAAKYESDDRLV